MSIQDDWRLTEKDSYWQNYQFRLIEFKARKGGSMHTHCAFCWHKFMEHPEGIADCSSEGFCSVDGKHWVCKECFDDFKTLFNWTIIE